MSHAAYQKKIGLVQYTAGYHPRPVVPPRTDGASLLPILFIGHSNSFSAKLGGLNAGETKRKINKKKV